jgi:hypothetical protein
MPGTHRKPHPYPMSAGTDAHVVVPSSFSFRVQAGQVALVGGTCAVLALVAVSVSPRLAAILAGFMGVYAVWDKVRPKLGSPIFCRNRSRIRVLLDAPNNPPVPNASDFLFTRPAPVVAGCRWCCHAGHPRWGLHPHAHPWRHRRGSGGRSGSLAGYSTWLVRCERQCHSPVPWLPAVMNVDPMWRSDLLFDPGGRGHRSLQRIIHRARHHATSYKRMHTR